MAGARSTAARRLVFVGEAPSEATARHGGTPLVGLTGERLAQWAGLSRSEFRRRARCVNLFASIPQKWDAGSARLQMLNLFAEGLLSEEDMTLVLLGDRVRAALTRQALRPFRLHRTWWGRIGFMPHPSGRNRFWNDARNVRRAERFLRRLAGQALPPTQGRLV